MRLASTLRTAVPVTLLFVAIPLFGQRANSIQDIGNRNINSNQSRSATLESEMAMGRAMSRELEANVTLTADPAVQRLAERVSQNIARNSDVKVPLTIRVMDAAENKAIGLPGGFLYLSWGLILASDNEAEFAGVIAREVAHVAARHHVENAARGSFLGMASTPLTGFGIQAKAIWQATSIGVPLGIIVSLRTQELEADWLGLQYLYKAGYDPNAMVRTFEKLEARENARKKKGPSLFDTLPLTEERIKRLRQQLATNLPARAESALTTSEFEDVKRSLATRK
jgi:beta-barrel assembly-enhancing protease